MQRVMAAIFVLNTRQIPAAKRVFAIWPTPLRSLHSSNASDRVLAHWVKYRLKTRMPGLNTRCRRADEGSDAGNQYRPLGLPRQGCSEVKPSLLQRCFTRRFGNCLPHSRPNLPPPRQPSWKPGVTRCWMRACWTKRRWRHPSLILFFARMAAMPSRRPPLTSLLPAARDKPPKQ